MHKNENICHECAEYYAPLLCPKCQWELDYPIQRTKPFIEAGWEPDPDEGLFGYDE